MGQQQQEAIEFEQVTVRRADRLVLDEISARIPAAGITVVAGPSGAGKTTLLRLCNRLDIPAAGRVWYRGQPLDELDPLALRRRVGMVFQRPTPFPGMTGLILAGAAPLQAVLVQTVVMFLVLAATATTTTVIALGLIRRLFTPDHRLIYLPAPADH